MKEITKRLKKLERTERDYILIDDWKCEMHLPAEVVASMSDEDEGKQLKTALKKRGMEEFEVKRYMSVDDLCIHNTMVAEEVLLSKVKK